MDVVRDISEPLQPAGWDFCLHDATLTRLRLTCARLRSLRVKIDSINNIYNYGNQSILEVQTPEQIGETCVRAKAVEQRVNLNREYQSGALFISLL